MDIFIAEYFERYYKECPLTVIDAGARDGLEKKWRSASKHLKTIGFEPDRQEFDRLINLVKNKNAMYFNTALYDKKTTLDFYIMRDRALSSVFKPNRKFLDNFPDNSRYDILQTIRIPVDTLDNIINGNNNIDVDFIKLDTQGSELSILKGASCILNSFITGLEIEAEFVPLYEDQPLFCEVNEFVRKLGFQLFDLRPYFWKRSRGAKYGKSKGQIITMDALYLMEIDKFIDILGKISDISAKKNKALRFISTCLIYGYLDYALEVFEASKNIFTDIEAGIFNNAMSKEVCLARKIPNFKGKTRISDTIKNFSSFMHPSNNGWVYWRKDLGNL